MSSISKKAIRIVTIAFMVSLWAFSLTPCVLMAATITFTDLIAKPGDTITMEVVYAAEGDLVSSLNFDVDFDTTRLTLSGIQLGATAVASAKTMDHNAVTTGKERVIVYGLNNTTLNNGVLLLMQFRIASTVSDGEIPVNFTGCVGATAGAVAVTVTGSSNLITVDASAPVITLTEPLNNEYVGSAMVTVSGSVDDSTIDHVDINGATVPVVNRNFSVDISLSQGDNVITVTAIDQAQQIGVVTITVHFILGDINEDGHIDANDVTMLKNQILGRTVFTSQADVNTDGIVNVLDLQCVINKI